MKKDFINFIKSHYFLIFILAVVNLLIAFIFVKTPLRGNGDLPSYLEAMKFLQGRSYGGEFMINRVLTSPLMLYSSIFIGYLVGGEQIGMLAVNLIFYFLIIFIFFEIVKLVYRNEKIAVFASILFFANYSMFNYGTTYRTDMGGWFFFVLSLFFAVKYFKEKNRKYFYLAVFVSSVGVLFKEYGALGLVSLVFLILFSSVGFKEKIKKIFGAAALFLIIPGLYYLFFYLRYNYSYFNWYFQVVDIYIKNPQTSAIKYSPILLIKVLGWLFLAGWPIFLWGGYQEYKNFDRTRAKILLAILPASLAFLAWPALTQRIAFIFVPWLALISGFGLSKIKNRYLVISILIIYVLVNYFTRPWLLSIINL